MGSQVDSGRVVDALLAMRRKGVQIWTENGRLHYQSPKGAVTADEMEQIRALKAEIVEFLQQSRSSMASESPLVPRLPSDRVPLTFVQQLHRNMLPAKKNRSMRMDATGVRICGCLDIESIRRAFVELVRRHEPLRTRIVSANGVPMQQIDKGRDYDLEIIDLTAVPSIDREIAAKVIVGRFVSEPIDLDVGPLFGAKLLKLEANDYVLAIAMEHIISDAASVGILWRDIWTLYAQSSQKMPFALPAILIQFADYAVWQQKTSQLWLKKHDAYWSKCLAGAKRIRLFEDKRMNRRARPDWGSISIKFDSTLTSMLRELGRQERTTLAATVFTAYIACISRWTEESDLLIPFMTMGREKPALENTVGYFASTLLVRVRRCSDDSLLDLLRRVRTAYATAFEHDDFGRIAARVPRPEFVGNPSFNWFPDNFSRTAAGYTPNVTVDGLGQAIRLRPFAFEIESFGDFDDLEWDNEPELALADTKDGIVGSLSYHIDRVDLDSVERFERNIKYCAERLVREPKVRVTDLTCS